MERRQPAVQLWTKSFRCVFSKKSIKECVCQPLPTHDVQLEEELFISSRQIAQHQSLCAACSSAWRILPHALCKPQTLVALGVMGPQSRWLCSASGRLRLMAGCSRSRFSRVVSRFCTGGVQSEAASGGAWC